MSCKLLPALCLLALPVSLRASEEDELLFFGIPVVEEKIAPTTRPAPKSAPSASEPSKIPLQKKDASIQVLLLDMPAKALATARLATLSISASQAGTTPVPEIIFASATPSLAAAADSAADRVRASVKSFPDGLSVRYKLNSSYGGHERDSAAVSCAVLLEALASNRELDGEVAFAGGVDSKGLITPAHGLASRLNTLTAPVPPAVGVALSADTQVRDLALTGEFDSIARTQIIGLATIDDAVALASARRPENLAKAMELFRSVKEAAKNMPMGAFIKNPKVQQRLAEVVQLAPNHLSAKYLLAGGQGAIGGKMSFLTSQQMILKSAKPFWDQFYKNRMDPALKQISVDSGNVLLQIQPHVHPVTDRYCTAMKGYIRAYTNFLNVLPGAQYNSQRNAFIKTLNEQMKYIQVEAAKLKGLTKVED